MKKFFSEKWQKIIKACSFLIIGLAFILVPSSALSVTLRIIGGLLLIYEAIEIYEIFKAYRHSTVLSLVLINEVFLVLLALMLLINPLGAVRTLSLIVGIYFLVFGSVGLYRSIGAKDIKGIVLNSVSALVGFMLLVLPYVFQSLITLILGIALIIKGVNLLLPLINNSNNKDNDNYYM